MATDLSVTSIVLNANRRAWRERMRNEYERVLPELQQAYRDRSPEERERLRKLDQAFHAHVDHGDPDDAVLEPFLDFARGVSPGAFPPELLHIPPVPGEAIRATSLLIEELAAFDARHAPGSGVCRFDPDDCGPECRAGISQILAVDGRGVTLEVFGMKPVADGSGWRLSNRETVTVEWIRDQGRINPRATADAAYTACLRQIEPWFAADRDDEDLALAAGAAPR